MPQRTLTIIKPDAFQQRVVGEVIRQLEQAGFRVIASSPSSTIGMHGPDDMKVVRLSKKGRPRCTA